MDQITNLTPAITPCPDVNDALHQLLASAQAIPNQYARFRERTASAGWRDRLRAALL